TSEPTIRGGISARRSQKPGPDEETEPHPAGAGAFGRHRPGQIAWRRVEASAKTCQASARREQSRVQRPARRRGKLWPVRSAATDSAWSTVAKCSNESYLA